MSRLFGTFFTIKRNNQTKLLQNTAVLIVLFGRDMGYLSKELVIQYFNRNTLRFVSQDITASICTGCYKGRLTSTPNPNLKWT